MRALIGTFEFNDLGLLDAAFDERREQPAAVTLEPCAAEEPAPNFLDGVVERAHAAAAAIFDEITTGFRLAPRGTEERYGVSRRTSRRSARPPIQPAFRPVA